ncbi:HEAT repeat domain-containing protein [Streptomyces sp. NPDC051561]|uniref:HEAT repeat domain-containing protein n=1 Tax=Streptomyces sp. NPDC051561 TaxID=3365658 RepID=UPI0037AC1838
MSAPDARARRLARLAAQVDWSKVVDPYVVEGYGPDVLDALWSADRNTADRACTNLDGAACGDGSSVRAAAAEMLPFLVEAARDPDVTVRFEILRVIAGVAGTGNTAPTQQVAANLRGKWRPTVDPAWPAAWRRAADGLLPLLDDEDELVRAGAVEALAQAAAHADILIPRLRTCFESEPARWMAECLVQAVGELARHAVEQREEALAWLRLRMADEGKGEEPDFVEDIDAWIAWDEEVRHDVRLQAVAALRRALPDHTDPGYARVTRDALLAPAPASASAIPPVEYLSAPVDVITEADQRLGPDLPGRLSLAHALLGHGDTTVRAGGLRVAAGLMSRWRSAVPGLLPDVADLVDDTCVENRLFALRVLAMCGAAARPWADLVAAHLGATGAAAEAVREHACWALSRMGDERCVPALAELLGTHDEFTSSHTGSADRNWNVSDLSLAEALAPFAAHPLLRRDVGVAAAVPGERPSEQLSSPMGSRGRKPHFWSDPPEGAVERARARWQATGDPEEVLPALLELTRRSAAEVYQTPGGAEALGLLAEVAATAGPAVVERVAEQLRATVEARIRHGNPSDAVRAVRSLWQLTSDPRRVVQDLIDLVRICPPPGSAGVTVLDPLRLLADVAVTDPGSVAPAMPVLRALLDADERPVRHDHWGAGRDDDALRAAIRAVLVAQPRGTQPPEAGAGDEVIPGADGLSGCAERER